MFIVLNMSEGLENAFVYLDMESGEPKKFSKEIDAMAFANCNGNKNIILKIN